MHERPFNDEDDDRHLLARLRGVARAVDPVPANLVELGRAAFDMRTLDAELAALVLDSERPDLAAPAGALVRGTGQPRLLTFETSDVTIEIEHDERRLRGQLLPPQAAVLVVQHAAGAVEASADADGRFALDGVSAGPVRIRATLAGRPPIETAWTSGISGGPSGS